MRYYISQTINKITGAFIYTLSRRIPKIPLVLCTDFYSLYKGIIKLGTTAEKRLIIDIIALKELYEFKKIEKIRWINNKNNPADAITKALFTKTLKRFINNNEITIRIARAVNRKKGLRSID